jgi:hypothetical protein
MKVSLSIIVLLATMGRADATDITACGQGVQTGETGVLTTDLVCTDSLDVDGGTLDFAGHTITQTGGGRAAVVCGDSCTLTGPGEITGAHASDPNALASGVVVYGSRVTIQDLHIHDNDWGIAGQLNHTAILNNVTVSNSVHSGIYLNARVKGTNVTVSNSGEFGLLGSQGVGMSGVTVTGSGMAGVISAFRRLALTDSTVTGNGGGTLDLLSPRRPKLKNTVCDHSAMLNSDESAGPPWGVCTQD